MFKKCSDFQHLMSERQDKRLDGLFGSLGLIGRIELCIIRIKIKIVDDLLELIFLWGRETNNFGCFAVLIKNVMAEGMLDLSSLQWYAITPMFKEEESIERRDIKISTAQLLSALSLKAPKKKERKKETWCQVRRFGEAWIWWLRLLSREQSGSPGAERMLWIRGPEGLLSPLLGLSASIWVKMRNRSKMLWSESDYFIINIFLNGLDQQVIDFLHHTYTHTLHSFGVY